MNDKFINKLKKIKNKDGKLDMSEISRTVKKVISKTYEFMGYEKFVNLIKLCTILSGMVIFLGE